MLNSVGSLKQGETTGLKKDFKNYYLGSSYFHLHKEKNGYEPQNKVKSYKMFLIQNDFYFQRSGLYK